VFLIVYTVVVAGGSWISSQGDRTSQWVSVALAVWNV
jgi:hypothetical protein